MKLKNVKVGDVLTRSLGGIPMKVVVGEVTETTIKVGSEDGKINHEIGWTFDRETGAEIDEDLEWGPQYGVTGSFIV